MAGLTPRLRQVLYGVVTAVVGVALLYVAYEVLGPMASNDAWWTLVAAGFTGLFGITALLLSLFLFFIPAALAGR